MGKYNFKKNDCFLLRNEDINKPMTVYQIMDMSKKHIWAKSISITNIMIHGMPIAHKYEKPIPEDALPLPTNSWQWAKKQMIAFVKEMNTYIRDNAVKGKSDPVIGGHYMDSRSNITTIKEINEDEIKYDLFKFDEDFISPYWTGSYRKDATDEWYTISDSVYNEAIRRYNEFLLTIRKRFCK